MLIIMLQERGKKREQLHFIYDQTDLTCMVVKMLQKHSHLTILAILKIRQVDYDFHTFHFCQFLSFSFSN